MLFAGMRARAVAARVVVLRCARVPGLRGWVGLDKDISQDAIGTARLKAVQHADIIESRVGIKAELVISEDDAVDAIRALVERTLRSSR